MFQTTTYISTGVCLIANFLANEIPACCYNRELDILIKSNVKHGVHYSVKFQERTLFVSQNVTGRNMIEP